jgi:hypothetical protein
MVSYLFCAFSIICFLVFYAKKTKIVRVYALIFLWFIMFLEGFLGFDYLIEIAKYIAG